MWREYDVTCGGVEYDDLRWRGYYVGTICICISGRNKSVVRGETLNGIEGI